MKTFFKRGILHAILACELALVVDLLLIMDDRLVSITWFYLALFALWLLLMLAVRISVREQCLLVVAVPLLVAVCSAAVVQGWKSLSRDLDYADVDTGKSDVYGGKTVMAIVPHEDDELNIAGGVLEEFVNYGSDVYVVFLTNGDYWGTGEQRVTEAMKTMAFLGIEEDHMILLGYGDTWGNGPHIYNAEPQEALISKAGYTHTYGTAGHPVYREGALYTRENLLADIKSVILEYQPDILLCSDYDFHVDHKALTLLFEEAMGELLREQTGYTPVVLKAYAYNTAWYARRDFYSLNIQATENVFADPYNQMPAVYRWDERVRLPVAAETLSRSLMHSKAYAALECYRSQDADMKASSVVNGDKVFWERRTDSLLYNAAVKTSSGAGELLRDFKLIDSVNILSDALPCDGTWVPAEGDRSKSVTVSFAEPRDIYEITLYDNPSLEDNVSNALITFDNGLIVETGELDKTGSASRFYVQQTDVESFTIVLESTEGERAGLSEVEAYEQPDESPFTFLKLMDTEGHFAYDYVLDASGKGEFALYAFGDDLPALSSEEYVLWLDNESCSARIVDGLVQVECPAGESCVLTVASRENPELSDSVHLQNPALGQRARIHYTQLVERLIYNGYCNAGYQQTVFYRTPRAVRSILQ